MGARGTAGFDVVLIDSPPLSLVTDAAVLSGRVDGVLFVLDFQKTKRAAAKRAVRTLLRWTGDDPARDDSGAVTGESDR